MVCTVRARLSTDKPRMYAPTFAQLVLALPSSKVGYRQGDRMDAVAIDRSCLRHERRAMPSGRALWLDPADSSLAEPLHRYEQPLGRCLAPRPLDGLGHGALDGIDAR